MNLTDAHYFQLPSQGNVYSLAKLSMCDGLDKILVASLRRKIFSFEFLQDLTEGYLQPTVKEILFTYIPSGAEIVSIDAFNRSETCDEFVIGITIIKSSGEPSEETYLNIYSAWEPSVEFNLDNVAQNCLMLELNYIPYQLYHTNLFIASNDGGHIKEVVWLLSGSDCKVHLFREDRLNHCYGELNVLDHFVEFSEPPSVVLWMDVYYCRDLMRRVSAYGCECGFVKLSVVDIWKNEILSSWSSQSDGPISSVRVFTTEPYIKCPSFIVTAETECDSNEPPVHFLVTNTLKPSVVYMDVLEQGLAECLNLPDSNQSDAVLCSCVADVNMDGLHEILLGTYGQQMLVYGYRKGRESETEIADTSEKRENQEGGWELLSDRQLANPIHCLHHLDMTGDGVREMVVVTLRGVHVMQHETRHVAQVFAQRLEQITLDSGLTTSICTSDNTV